MFNTIRSARAAGIRSGVMPRNRFTLHSDGTKTMIEPRNPFLGHRRLLAAIWEFYYQETKAEQIRKGK